MTLSDAICNRRTYYSLSSETPITNDKLEGIIELAVKHTPSAFNMQSARLVVLSGKSHEQLWDLTLTALKQVVPYKQVQTTTDKINAFRKAYGTILFFDDSKVVGQMISDYPIYEKQFFTWAMQANGMLQLNIWMLLEEVGFGASLQHYNPLIDSAVRETWNLPKSWQLVAQMPFGIPVCKPDVKTFVPVNERIKFYLTN